jgi:hypothetical protein
MRNILERAFWAALWGFTSAVPVAQITAALAGSDLDALTQLALAGIGGATSALLSFVKTVAGERMGYYPSAGADDGVAE